MADMVEAYRKLNETKHMLLLKANAAYASIRPCGGRKEWDDCYTIVNEHLILWFDDCDSRSTHIVTAPLHRLDMNTKSLVLKGLLDENGRFSESFRKRIVEETHGEWPK